MPLAAAADLIKGAKKIVVVSGSGISAAAGLSTYVGGKDGLYEKARKRYKLEKGIDLFGWRFYSERPRDAQKFLAELAVADEDYEVARDLITEIQSNFSQETFYWIQKAMSLQSKLPPVESAAAES